MLLPRLCAALAFASFLAFMSVYVLRVNRLDLWIVVGIAILLAIYNLLTEKDLRG